VSLPFYFGSPALKMRTCADCSQPEGASLKAVGQPHVPMALLAQRHRDCGCLLVLPPQTSNIAWVWLSLPDTSGSSASKMRTSADIWQAEKASLESCCSASSAHGTACKEAQRLGLLACLATSNFKHSLVIGVLAGSFCSPALKMQTSADSSQPEGAGLGSSCSNSCAHGTARTEAQRVGMLACLATSNVKRILRGPCSAPSAALLGNCERLQIARRQKGLASKAVAQPHVPMALLTQRHRVCGC